MRGLFVFASARTARFVAACVPLLVLVPSLAWAQTQAIDPNLVVKRDLKEVENSTIVYANIADCGGDDGTKKGSEFEFSVTYNTNVAVVEAWLGVGDINCATPANRLKSSTLLVSNCIKLGSDTSNARTPVITVTGKQLFDKDGAADRNFVCDSVSGSPMYTVYILPLAMATTDTVAPTVLPLTPFSSLRATFTPYTRRPAAPTNLRGQRGESRLGVNFDAPSSSVALTKYKAYFDVSGGAGSGVVPTTDAGMVGGSTDAGVDSGSTDVSGDGGAEDAGATAGDTDAGGLDSGANDAGVDSGSLDASTDGGDTDDDVDAPAAALMCGSGQLEGNVVAPINQSNIRSSGNSNTESAALTDLTGVSLGTSVAVAVVTIDPAGNESLLSNPICIDRIPTEGYLDSCTENDDCGLESCSFQPGAKSGFTGLALLALALTALIRRRGRA